ncbi:hypothetical protein GQ53DRAFT_740211 [Thozetella sp. PMI_491]|nr:hypothetical protein GQ53DRAFT_740211 [Thozetella sp. PMI_491]
MASSHRDSLSEDWEDLGDDNLSVISLPSSEKEETSKLVNEKGPALSDYELALRPKEPTPVPIPTTKKPESSTAVPSPANEFTETPTFGNFGHRYSAKFQGRAKNTESTEWPLPLDDEKEDKSRGGAPSVDLINSSVESFSKTIEPTDTRETEPEGGSESLVKELLDSRGVNPDFILKTLESLDGIISDTLLFVQDNVVDEDILSKIPIIYAVQFQISELKPIVSGYAQAHRGTSSDLPLDPGLHEWLSGVRVKMITLQAELQTPNRPAPGDKEGNTSRLVHTWEALEEHRCHMEVFLPIMQVDYNVFQTRRMNLPVVETPADWSFSDSPVRSAPIDIPRAPNSAKPPPSIVPRSRPTSDGWLLRRELYNLKDELQRAIQHLHNLSGLQLSQKALAKDIAKAYETVSQTVSVVLSNHGSDWIESGLSGGLTYGEFMELEADCIRDFTIQLERTVDEIDPKSASCRTIFDPCRDLDDNPHDRPSLLTEGRLDRLESLAQVLMATLIPNRK